MYKTLLCILFTSLKKLIYMYNYMYYYMYYLSIEKNLCAN